MDWQRKISHLMGQPIGVSFTNGQGASGILCDANGGQLYLMEYMYHSQFALKHYDYQMIQDINGFPPCHQNHHNHHHQQPLY
ncbi:hypothetical protein [Halalkalibacter okhensis]|uniref:Uncharacterized protein n=1 Tax=Halalkalibacter okhensis TaxID=333138 RepID=A0A0B0IE31_9BACI|nr:hypothetical protein [Halalkalibacter okhensis]KHF39147.1 hypothetical protein LQ50_17120 [Halalkalibacter okhensis]